ncbi:hypothetical protein B0T37_10745 [Chromobacterium violaceum]|uniref:hypothetical protein n=1 Tax=Chromobacterium violaceum TaxID=536 RepID=UPI0009DAB4D5|nr:hypothetical protein [Chromobacterium violaceum]OQS10116.1 hypothetical protein B0T38_11140 [Chromobacterium violaceum]OQS26531.1 hypothetical protein B0T37_10745 [Chromobacterium violaceum]
MDDEFDIDLHDLNEMGDEFNKIMSQVDTLFEHYGFLVEARGLLEHFHDRVFAIKKMALEIDYSIVSENFLPESLWVAAISAYEGYMHKLYLSSLDVCEFQEIIMARCDRFTNDNMHGFSRKNRATKEKIKDWYSRRTVSNPFSAQTSFEEFYNILLPPMLKSEAYWDDVISVRNEIIHRNGPGVPIKKESLIELVDGLDQHVATLTTSMVRALNSPI